MQASRPRGLDARSITICRPLEAATHALRALGDALRDYTTRDATLGEALDTQAERHNMPPDVFRAAVRLALRILANTHSQ